VHTIADVRTAFAAALALVALALVAAPVQAQDAPQRVAAVSFQYLGALVEKLGGDLWEVAVVVPPGVDPHEYSLSPKDVDLLRRAEVVVVTNHTLFEQRILELVSEGELRPTSLVVAEETPGVRLLPNPETGSPNLHLPYYDPENLKALLGAIAESLSAADPSSAETYRGRLRALVSQISALEQAYSGRLRERAVGSSPLVQYAVGWLGVEISALVVAEHGAPPSPQKLSEIESRARAGEFTAVVVRVYKDGELWRPSTQYDEYLIELAKKAGLKVIAVPDPLTSSPDLLSNLELIAKSATGEANLSVEVSRGASFPTGAVAALIAIFVAAIGIIVAWARRR